MSASDLMESSWRSTVHRWYIQKSRKAVITMTGTLSMQGQPPLAEGWNMLLARYRRAAATMLQSHVPAAGELCAECGKDWPCRRTRAAGFVLEL